MGLPQWLEDHVSLQTILSPIHVFFYRKTRTTMSPFRTIKQYQPVGHPLFMTQPPVYRAAMLTEVCRSPQENREALASHFQRQAVSLL